jgi:hypothetical protein
MSVMKNWTNSEAKRGAIVKSLAIGSKHLWVLEPLTKLIEKTMDIIYSKFSLKSTLEQNIAS